MRLPDVPDQFDAALAMSITGNKSLEHLTALLLLIPDFSLLEYGDANDQTRTVTQSMNSTARLRRYAAKLRLRVWIMSSSGNCLRYLPLLLISNKPKKLLAIKNTPNRHNMLNGWQFRLPKLNNGGIYATI